jgi:hypothetical protein
LNSTPALFPKQGAEAQLAWAGFFEELAKQGANEDFILGMMKEAEESEDHSRAALDSTGLPMDRHRIVPFMSNNLTGSMAGGLAGGAVSSELGLGSLGSMILPALGALAGHHYLPHLMNRWKDSEGTGLNRISPIAANYNSQQPLGVSE